MKILFHITGYRCPDQFSWLYQAIYNQQDLFIIHIDEKSPADLHASFRKITAGHANTYFLPSIRVTWGGTGLIQAELAALRLGFQLEEDWQYLINLTAQDYLNAPLEHIRCELSNAWPANFVMCIPLKETHWRIQKRCWFHYLEFRDRRYFAPIPSFRNRRLNINWHGPWWHVLTRDFCRWWLEDPKGDQYFEALKNAGMPDELLLQNLINDSPYKATLRSECKHEIIWRHPGKPAKLSAHPKVLTIDDLPILSASQAFFARKFDATVDQDILEILARKFTVCPAINPAIN